MTTARPLETEETTLLEKLLTEKFQKPVQIQQEKVEPKVVGGVLVQYGDHVFDATMQRQLEKMDALMKEIHLQDQDLEKPGNMTEALSQGVKNFQDRVDLEEIGVVEKSRRRDLYRQRAGRSHER